MVDRTIFWTRAGALGGIVFFFSLLVLIALMPLSHSVQEPAFDAPSSAVLAYARSETDLPFALSLIGVLGLFGFAVFAAVLTTRFRLEGSRWDVASTLVLLAAVTFMVLWLAELGLGLGQTFRRNDLDATGASVLSGLANGIFVVSWSAIAAFLGACGFAVLWTRTLPSWLGWSAVVIGIAMFLSGAAPLTSVWLLPYVMFFGWVLAASVVLLRTGLTHPS